MATADEIAAQEAALLAALEEQYRLEEEALLEEQMRMEAEMFAEEMALLGETDPNIIAELQAERQAAKLKDIVAKNKKNIADKKKRSVLPSSRFPVATPPASSPIAPAPPFLHRSPCRN